MELSTIARFRLNPIVVVFNNRGYGTERPMLDGPFNDIHPWKFSKIPEMLGAGKGFDVNTEDQARQFLQLMHWMQEAGYEHYEISNFALPGKRSRHNSSYWQGAAYLGLGPSAHSFNGESRQWNISNNALYIQSLKAGKVPFEIETLTETQRLNEYIMTSLRTMEGLDIQWVATRFSDKAASQLQQAGKPFIATGKMQLHSGHLQLTKDGKLFADGIAAELFFTPGP